MVAELQEGVLLSRCGTAANFSGRRYDKRNVYILQIVRLRYPRPAICSSSPGPKAHGLVDYVAFYTLVYRRLTRFNRCSNSRVACG